jgi:hypothetical protein
MWYNIFRTTMNKQMKLNNLYLIIATLMFGISNAGFIVKIPLEQLGGGNLPDKSITFTNGDTETVEPTEPEPGHYEISLSIYIQNSGNNILYNGVSQPGASNAESSYLDLSSNTFYLSKDYENYFWRDGEYLEYIPNVGAYIDFNGTGSFCIISNISETSSGTTYSCSNTVQSIMSNEIIHVILTKRTN